MFRGTNGTPRNTHNIFFGIFFLLILLIIKKNIFWPFQDFYTKILSNYLLMFIFLYCKAINNDSTKWLFLDVHRKTRFLDVQTIPKSPKLKKCLLKKILRVLVIKLLILFVHKKMILWLITSNWWFQKKNIACELHF